MLLCPITRDEIQKALFSIPGDKSPRPNGFGTHFFTDGWNTMRKDIIDALKDFFNSDNLLKEINITMLTLIPKVKCPSHVFEFRPIACCNVVYKCITKVMCMRVRDILAHIIS